MNEEQVLKLFQDIVQSANCTSVGSETVLTQDGLFDEIDKRLKRISDCKPITLEWLEEKYAEHYQENTLLIGDNEFRATRDLPDTTVELTFDNVKLRTRGEVKAEYKKRRGY